MSDRRPTPALNASLPMARAPLESSVSGGQVHPEPVEAQRHHQQPGGERRRRARQRRRQRLHVPLGLAHRIQLPEAPRRSPARLHGLGGGNIRDALRPFRLAPHHDRGRQDHQDIQTRRHGDRGNTSGQLATRDH